MSEQMPPWGPPPPPPPTAPLPPLPSSPQPALPPPPPGYGYTPAGYGGAPPPPGYAPYGYGPYGPQMWPVPTAATRLGLVDASFGERLGALLIDQLIQLAFIAPGIVAVVVWLASTFETKPGVCTNDFGREYVCDVPTDFWYVQLVAGIGALVVVNLLVGLLYQALTEGRSGQTVGKRVLGIRVVDMATGQSIGIARAIGRFLGKLVSNQIFSLGFLWMLWDKDKQTWHDKMVRSVVVKARL